MTLRIGIGCFWLKFTCKLFRGTKGRLFNLGEKFAGSSEGDVTANSPCCPCGTHPENPHLDPDGINVGRAQMVLGVLYKIKKNPPLRLNI